MDNDTIDKLTLQAVTSICQDKAQRVSPDFATKREIDELIAASLDRLVDWKKDEMRKAMADEIAKSGAVEITTQTDEYSGAVSIEAKARVLVRKGATK